MYHHYFGLKEPAFSIAVNPKYLYMSRQHKEALAHLIYGVQSGGFVMLSGEVGTGKTTIIRCLLDQLPKRTEIAIILNPMNRVDEMLQTICEELSIEVISKGEPSTKSYTDALYEYLLANHADQKNTVLLIDEAQLLSAEVLEQIRLLTNLETASQKLLQIVLVGQPELNKLLAQPGLRQLSQRITARFHLKPLSEQETELYIRHRLRVAGKKDNRILFPRPIIRKIHEFSNGVPRLINILCERLLIGTYGHNKDQVDDEIYQIAYKEVEGNRKVINTANFKLLQNNVFLLGSAAAIFLVLIGALIWLLLGTNTPSDKVISGNITRPNIKDSKKTSEKHSVNSGLIPSLNASELSSIDSSKISDSLTEPKDSGSQVFVDSSSDEYEISLESAALKVLFNYHEVPAKVESHPCWQSDKHGFTCQRIKMKTWDELRELNRSAILSLITEDKRKVYTVVIGISDNMAKLLTIDSKKIIVPLRNLGRLWDSEVLFIWQKPDTFSSPLVLGSSSPTISWVAKQFALLDQQTIPLAKNSFTKPLQERVKIFQAQYNLESDGIIGERTIMKLNEALGDALELQTNMSD